MGSNQHVAAKIKLTEEERTVLEGYARRRKTAQALATRARIILRCAEGGHDGVVADELGGPRERSRMRRSSKSSRRRSRRRQRARPTGAPATWQSSQA